MHLSLLWFWVPHWKVHFFFFFFLYILHALTCWGCVLIQWNKHLELLCSSLMSLVISLDRWAIKIVIFYVVNSLNWIFLSCFFLFSFVVSFCMLINQKLLECSKAKIFINYFLCMLKMYIFHLIIQHVIYLPLMLIGIGLFKNLFVKILLNFELYTELC